MMMFRNEWEEKEEGLNYGAYFGVLTTFLSFLLVLFATGTVVFVGGHGAQIAFPWQGLDEKQRQLESRQLELEDWERALQEQQDALQGIRNVRAEIAGDLFRVFSQTGITLDLDRETGTIRLSGGVLFDFDKDIIKPAGRQFLDQVMPVFFTVLLNEKYIDYLAEIIIEGHTSDEGTYLYNLNLSQRRAYEIARYILTNSLSDFPEKELIHRYLTATGRASSRPVIVDGIIDKDQSRRVEFKFRLIDEEFPDQIEDFLSGKEQP